MLNNRQKLGKKGEEIAADALKKRGYRILEKNYRTPMGEIDIIAMDKGAIVFVEVKTRRSGQYGDPKCAVDRRKQAKISMSALKYLKDMKKMGVSARFDVVAIQSQDGANRIEIIKNAFELAYG
jgi:putative endonuclease